MNIFKSKYWKREKWVNSKQVKGKYNSQKGVNLKKGGRKGF